MIILNQGLLNWILHNKIMLFKDQFQTKTRYQIVLSILRFLKHVFLNPSNLNPSELFAFL